MAAFAYLGFRLALPLLIHSGLGQLFGLGGQIKAVDAGQVLHLSRYDVQLLASNVGPVPVPQSGGRVDLYPAGMGTRVSLEVLVTNTTNQWLRFPSAATPITLQIPIIKDTQGQVYDFAPALTVAGEPGSSIATIGDIPPHGSTTGWVSFITPIWTPQVIHRQASDLEFAPVSDSDYEPEIRLWEADTPAGAAAAGLTTATK